MHSEGDCHGQSRKEDTAQVRSQFSETSLPDQVDLGFSPDRDTLLNSGLPAEHLDHAQSANSFRDGVDTSVGSLHTLLLVPSIELREQAWKRHGCDHNDHTDQGRPSEDAVEEDHAEYKLDRGEYEDEGQVTTYLVSDCLRSHLTFNDRLDISTD